jgi:hypothetical protein
VRVPQDGCTYERSALMDLFAQARKLGYPAVSPVTGQPLDSEPQVQNPAFDVWYAEVLGLIRTLAPDCLALGETIPCTPAAVSTPIDHLDTDPLSFSMPLPLSTARTSDANGRGRYHVDRFAGTDAVEEWLRAIGLPMYANAFQAASVDPPTLMSLSDEDLRQGLGITDRIHRVKLLAHRSDLRQRASQPKSHPSDAEYTHAVPRLLAATTAHPGYAALPEPAAAIPPARVPPVSSQSDADSELLFVVVGGGTSVGLMLPLGEPARFTRCGHVIDRHHPALHRPPDAVSAKISVVGRPTRHMRVKKYIERVLAVTRSARRSHRSRPIPSGRTLGCGWTRCLLQHAPSWPPWLLLLRPVRLHRYAQQCLASLSFGPTPSMRAADRPDSLRCRTAHLVSAVRQRIAAAPSQVASVGTVLTPGHTTHVLAPLGIAPAWCGAMLAL